jgi:Na+-translocating membrane potential-generating system (MpsC)
VVRLAEARVDGGNRDAALRPERVLRGERRSEAAEHGWPESAASYDNHEAVLDLRRRWQRIMKNDVSREIEELTGRKVIGFMSDNHIDPDLAVEVFVLKPLPRADAH